MALCLLLPYFSISGQWPKSLSKRNQPTERDHCAIKLCCDPIPVSVCLALKFAHIVAYYSILPAMQWQAWCDSHSSPSPALSSRWKISRSWPVALEDSRSWPVAAAHSDLELESAATQGLILMATPTGPQNDVLECIYISTQRNPTCMPPTAMYESRTLQPPGW